MAVEDINPEFDMYNLILPILALSACSTDEDGQSDTVEVNPSEVMTDDELYMVHLTPSSDPFLAGEEIDLGMHVMVDGEGISGATISATPFMVDMGHGISDEPVITEGDMGMYTATWTFSMAGYWEVEIEVDGSEGTDTVTVAYDVE